MRVSSVREDECTHVSESLCDLEADVDLLAPRCRRNDHRGLDADGLEAEGLRKSEPAALRWIIRTLDHAESLMRSSTRFLRSSLGNENMNGVASLFPAASWPATLFADESSVLVLSVKLHPVLLIRRYGV